MRLKTKLVLAATGLTFAIVLVLSAMFVSELLQQRIEQTAAANDVLVHDPIVPNVQFQGRWHDVRFFCEVDGGAVHALRRPGLIERGDEGRQINRVLVPLFKSNAPPFPPDEHKCQRDDPDE